MPYFISDSADGCDGWATIKGDGEVIGCHTTKQAAIDHMVAISIHQWPSAFISGHHLTI
jgi:hypothetical protein